jgi:hypothetical protein
VPVLISKRSAPGLPRMTSSFRAEAGSLPRYSSVTEPPATEAPKRNSALVSGITRCAPLWAALERLGSITNLNR